MSPSWPRAVPTTSATLSSSIAHRTPSRCLARPGEPEARREFVQTLASLQKPVEEGLLTTYQEAGGKRLRGDQQLAVSPIGSSALPVASVEVISRTLRTLADQPDVVAIMSNQKIDLIPPQTVNYEDLARREGEKGLTWGLELLGIPQLWETTRGSGITVAMLDTGVWGQHPALEGRVKDFVVVDPLGRQIQVSPPFDCG